MTNTKNDEFTDAEFEKDYIPFLVNKNLSYHPDCALVANEMNIRNFISNKNQYRFMNLIIRRRKRLVVWEKPTKNKNVEIVAKYYKISHEVAEEYAKVLSDDQVMELEERMDVGGRVK